MNLRRAWQQRHRCPWCRTRLKRRGYCSAACEENDGIDQAVSF